MNYNNIKTIFETSHDCKEMEKDSCAAVCRAILLGMAEEQLFSPGSVIFTEGPASDSRFFFLLEGTVEWSTNGIDEPISNGSIPPGQFFGERPLGVYLAPATRTRRAATVVARSDVEALVWDWRELKKVLDAENALHLINPFLKYVRKRIITIAWDPTIDVRSGQP